MVRGLTPRRVRPAMARQQGITGVARSSATQTPIMQQLLHLIDSLIFSRAPDRLIPTRLAVRCAEPRGNTTQPEIYFYARRSA